MIDGLLERRLVDIELLAESKVGNEHAETSSAFRGRDENVLRFDVAMNDLEVVQMSETGSYLSQRLLRI